MWSKPHLYIALFRAKCYRIALFSKKLLTFFVVHRICSLFSTVTAGKFLVLGHYWCKIFISNFKHNWKNPQQKNHNTIYYRRDLWVGKSLSCRSLYDKTEFMNVLPICFLVQLFFSGHMPWQMGYCIQWTDQVQSLSSLEEYCLHSNSHLKDRWKMKQQIKETGACKWPNHTSQVSQNNP